MEDVVDKESTNFLVVDDIALGILHFSRSPITL